MDAFELVFVNRFSPSSIVCVYRQVEEDDRQGRCLFLDFRECSSVVLQSLEDDEVVSHNRADMIAR